MKQTYRAIGYLVLSAFSFAVMNTFVKLSGNYPSFQKVFIRSVVILFFSANLIFRHKVRFLPKKENSKLLLLRSLAGSIAMICNYYAVDHLILSDATMIAKIAPFSTIVFSCFILKETVKLYQMLCIAIGILGATFIIKPEFNVSFLPSAVGVIGAIGSGFAYTLVRSLGNRGENDETIVFGFALISCVFTIPFVIFKHELVNAYDLFILGISGFFAFLGQVFVTKAYSLAPAKEISIFDFSQLGFAAIIGFFLFSETPDFISIIGYMIILGVSIFMFLKSNKENSIKVS